MVLPGCGRGAAPPAERSPAATEIDRGNVQFSAGDPASALEHYRAAAAANRSDPAAWFGIYMASRAVGDTVSAAEALLEVQKLVPDAAWQQHPHDVGVPTPRPDADPAAAGARAR